MRSGDFIVELSSVRDCNCASHRVNRKATTGRIKERISKRIARIEITGGNRAHRTAIAQVFVDRHSCCRQIIWSIVGALNSNSDLGRRSQSVSVDHRIGENVGDRIGCRS